jgi:acyl-ACP thioesterase
MIFREEYRTVIEDFNKNGRLSLCGVLKIFENTGYHHSDKAKDGLFKSTEETKTWILIDWQVEVKEFPLYSDKITAETWLEKLKSPLIAFRDFVLYKNGEPCAKGTSRWILFDLETLKICKIEQELFDRYEPENLSIFDDGKLPKIQIPETFEAEKQIAVRRSDIDSNNHVHNLIYLDYALESLPADIYEKAETFKELRITYKTAIKENSKIVGKYAKYNGKNIICIFDLNGEIKALIQLA